MPGIGRHVAGVLAALCALPGIGQSAPLDAPRLDRIASDVIAKSGVRSAAVAVVHDGKIAYRSENAETSGYVIGSVTKLFTAVAVMQLVEAGRLRLDDKLARWYAQFPNADAIALRDLLAHRSGIPDYLPRAFRSQQLSRPTTPEAIAALAATWKPDFAPNTDWNYSNTGYLLLGLIVEHVTGASLETYERAHIFDVAGMHETAVGRAATDIVLQASGAIDVAKYGAQAAHADLSWYFGCGDIVSTAADLARFDIALMDGRLVTQNTLRLMSATVTRTTIAASVGDGLGLFVRRVGPREIVGHHGGEPGYSADDEMILADRSAIAVLEASDSDAELLLRPLLEALYPSHVQTSDESTVDPDPALTTHLLGVIRSLIAGQLNAGDFTQEAAAGFTPVVLHSLHVAYGSKPPLSALTFRSKLYDSGLRVYHYVGRFGTQPAAIQVILDASGKIAALNLHNL